MIRTALVLALLAAPAFAEDSDHLSEKDGVRILHAWSRATDDHVGVLYFEVENTSGKEIELIGAESDAAEVIHIITSSIKSGGESLTVLAKSRPMWKLKPLTPTAMPMLGTVTRPQLVALQ